MDYTTLIVFVGVLAVAVAAPQTAPPDTSGTAEPLVAVAAPRAAPPDTSASGTAEPEVRVLSRKFRTDQLGNYVYGYKQSNGQIVKEVGHVPRGPEPSAVSLSQQGEFQFISEDGQTYQLSYVADEKGFQPQAIHLPQPPAQIPEYAQLRIDYPQLFWAEDSSL